MTPVKAAQTKVPSRTPARCPTKRNAHRHAKAAQARSKPTFTVPKRAPVLRTTACTTASPQFMTVPETTVITMPSARTAMPPISHSHEAT